MGYWEANGVSDEWYTPAYIFDALGEKFDLDVAHPPQPTNVPCAARLSADALGMPWVGFVWMNPPFGGRNGLVPWINRFCEHGNGIALVPDRTSAPWFQGFARRADALLFVTPKVKFERPDGSAGKSPSNGTALFAIGDRAVAALERAAGSGLGFISRL